MRTWVGIGAVLLLGSIAGSGLHGGVTAGAPAAPALTLTAGQIRGAQGPGALRVLMGTTADGFETQVTVFSLPGRRACPSDPLRPWPVGAVQLLYGFGPPPERRWDRTAEFSPGRVRAVTLCGYVVNEGNTRFDLPYVLRVRRVVAGVSGPRPIAGATRWAPCSGVGDRRIRMVEGRAAGGCDEARATATAWARLFSAEGGRARDNWGFGWRAADGSPLRITWPPTRVARVLVPLLHRRVSCVERTSSRTRLARLRVTCQGARFDFVQR